MPGAMNAWESIIERGRATSTYKMALALCISQMVERGVRQVSLRQLATMFFDIYLDRMRYDMPQLSDPNEDTVVEKAIAGYKLGQWTKDLAISRIEKAGFRHVLRAFHNLGSEVSPIRFYTFSTTSMELTEFAFEVFKSPHKDRLIRQIFARWSTLEDGFARNRLGNDVSLWVAGRQAVAGPVWCHASLDGRILQTGAAMGEFVKGIVSALDEGNRVSLGLEAPLSVSIPTEEPASVKVGATAFSRNLGLLMARDSKNFRSRDTYFVDPLVEAAWVIRQIRVRNDLLEPTLSWRRFVDGKSRLFLWQVSARGRRLRNTAEGGVKSFAALYPRLPPATPEEGTPFSLGTAMLMWAGFNPGVVGLRSQAVVVNSI